MRINGEVAIIDRAEVETRWRYEGEWIGGVRLKLSTHKMHGRAIVLTFNSTEVVKLEREIREAKERALSLKRS